ncbi:MAG: glycoside hydrolase family 9 protein [Longimicrobiales bacterium]
MTPRAGVRLTMWLATGLALGLGMGAGTGAGDSLFIRVNLVGWRPVDPKVAVACALHEQPPGRFDVVRASDRQVVLRGLEAKPLGAFAGCVATYRIDLSALRAEGEYRVIGGGATSPPVRIARDAYAGLADSTLVYLRQQRSRWNPLLRDSVHTLDGILVEHPDSGRILDVSGGWFDAADYLQYVTTSGTATFMLLQAWRDHPDAFGDAFDAAGLPGANGVPDVLDEARWGLDWLLRMYPQDDLLLNQIADDRDHAFWDLPNADRSEYGWGPGGARPVYACTGRPQGLFQHHNRSDGAASTAGKVAAAFALGAHVFARRGDVGFADTLARKSSAAYALGRRDPGVCQTAPARAPYFYEEGNWVDDMELAAALLYALTGEPTYAEQAMAYARTEPVTPWMWADTARHYEWYPWHNNGHYELWRARAKAGVRSVAADTLASFYAAGLARVTAGADNGFLIGVPFIWCSNDLVASFATQAILYRRMSGDDRFVRYEQAAIDWLFGSNPWGTSMIIGIPRDADYPTDPHSVIAAELGVLHTGALVDGPVYRTIFETLQYVSLAEADEYAPFNTGRVVYHDDVGDYSTNEPITDGTANLLYLLAERAAR